jgi:hypothetical protein
MNKRKGLKGAMVTDIQSAKGSKVNLDYYSMEITGLPDGWNAQDILNVIRLNFGAFMSENTYFRGFNPNERKLWNSSDPLGSVMSFDEYFEPTGVLGDDASVMTSAYYSDVNGGYWNFSTLRTPWGDWGHPVQGTRQFGVSANSSSSYTFYIRGVDRISDGLTQGHGVFTEEYIFKQAHLTWLDVMKNVRSYLEEKGAKVTSNPAVSERLDWSGDGVFQEYLKNR